MQKKPEARSQKSEETGQEACPTFTIRADMRWSVRALMGAIRELDCVGRIEAEQLVRAFELYEEARRRA